MGISAPCSVHLRDTRRFHFMTKKGRPAAFTEDDGMGKSSALVNLNGRWYQMLFFAISLGTWSVWLAIS